MTEEILYQDSQVVCYADRLEIKNYYFPLGNSKTIPYGKIRNWTQAKLTLMDGAYRFWGMSLSPHWFNLDPRRPSKTEFISLETGDWPKPALTPDHHEQFAEVLHSKVAEKR